MDLIPELTLKQKLKAKKNDRGRDHKSVDQDQEAKMQSPIPLKLSEIGLRGFLVVNLELVVGNNGIVVGIGGGESDLDVPEFLGGQAEGELVAAALVLEGVDAPQGLGDGDVEDEVGDGEEGDGDPAVAALEAGGLGQGQEDEAQEDEEYLEELVELLLLEVDGTLLLQGFLEVELDYGVQGLEGCFFRLVLVLDAAFVLCHGWKLRSSLVLVPTTTLPHFFAQFKY